MKCFFELQRRGFCVFFKKVVEMRRLLESQSVAYFSNVPVGVSQKVFRLLKHSFFYDLGGGKLGDGFYR